MARSINFQYKYPYNVFNNNSKYYMDWASNQISLNGFNLHPMEIKKTTPYIVDAEITIEICPTSGTNASGRSWRLYYYTGSSWNYQTFTMPSCSMNTWTSYTWSGAIGSNVTRIVACPASNSYSHYWENGMSINHLRVRETLTTADLSTSDYLGGIFTNQYGVTQKPSSVYVNMGGTITKATKVLVNIGGSLKELPPVYSGAYTTATPDSIRVYEFTAPSTRDYQIEVVLNSGDHELRLYNSSFTQIHPNGSSNSEGSYFYNGTFSLTSGSLYYISMIHYYTNTNISESVLYIY